MDIVQHEFEETLKRIQSQKDVFGVIVVKNNGDIITSTLDNRSSVSHAERIMKLADNAKSCVRNLDPSNELIVLRMGTKKREVLVKPGKDFIMIVLRKQNFKSLMRSIIANS
ncbi:dynein light chain roadblock-type 2-like [Acyrthosiphon pisum]|uniref:Dynein light chain roadblock n=1 Tax=Acyrthosiphon pisum TaxID=7029 RepID=A0A8R2A8X9_ACYPI|nr:dynein light chain roadblock-type 2-like [Acyrthosiphon pisum]|eukprot:XP_003243092.1 PREDICTED: dynein light chain roadblock-type 2-like isoform X1 [Acyrthosiphon pisum]